MRLHTNKLLHLLDSLMIHRLCIHFSSALSALFCCLCFICAVSSPFFALIDLDIPSSEQTPTVIWTILVFGIGTIFFFFSYKQKFWAHISLLCIAAFSIVTGRAHWLPLLIIFFINFPFLLAFIKPRKPNEM